MDIKKEQKAVFGYKVAVLVLCMSTLMSAIDTGIVTIGLSTIQSVFHASFASVQWVVLSYLLAVTSLIVGVGRIGDIFGKKKLFFGGIALFTVTSLLCGISATIHQLIAFRALQGIGGAVLISLSFAIIGDIVPKEKVMGSMAALTATLPIGFALGPSLGGILISTWSWRSIFFLNIPIGIAALLLSIKFPSVPVTEKIRRFDWPGMIVLAVGLTGYVLSITLAEKQGISREVVLLFALTVAGLAGFVILEKHTSEPLIQLQMFRDSGFSTSLIISVAMYMLINGCGLILPFYLQRAKGISTFFSGLMMMAGPVGCALFTPVAGRLANRYGSKQVMTFGVLMMGLCVAALSFLNLSTRPGVFAAAFFCCNGSLAFFQTPNNTFIMTRSKPELRGLTSGLLNLARTIGQTTGTAVLGTFFYYFIQSDSVAAASPENIVNGIHGTLLIGSLILGCAFLLGMTVFQPWKKLEL